MLMCTGAFSRTIACRPLSPPGLSLSTSRLDSKSFSCTRRVGGAPEGEEKEGPTNGCQRPCQPPSWRVASPPNSSRLSRSLLTASSQNVTNATSPPRHHVGAGDNLHSRGSSVFALFASIRTLLSTYSSVAFAAFFFQEWVWASCTIAPTAWPLSSLACGARAETL